MDGMLYFLFAYGYRAQAVELDVDTETDEIHVSNPSSLSSLIHAGCGACAVWARRLSFHSPQRWSPLTPERVLKGLRGGDE